MNSKLQSLIYAGALAASAALTGCSTPRNYLSANARTNTLPIKSGTQDYKFKGATLGELVTPGETYLALPFSKDKSVQIRDSGTTMIIDDDLEELVKRSLVLPIVIVPYSNSTTHRTPNNLTVIPNGKVYLAVNAYADSTGALASTSKDAKGPEPSFFRISEEQFKETLQQDGRGIVQQRIAEPLLRKEGLAVIDGKRYYSLPSTQGIENAPKRVLISVNGAQPLYTENRQSGKPTERKFGIESTGYYFAEAELVDKVKPSPANQPAVTAEPAKGVTSTK